MKPNKLKNIFLDFKKGLPITLGFILIPPTVSVIVFNKSIVFFLIFLFILIILVEIFFNFTHRLINGYPYKIHKKIPFDSLHIEPHPHLTYIYKKNFNSPPVENTRYPLHRGKFKTCALKTNNLGFFNGYNGDRDVVVPKPNDLFRINCLGASTTQNYISFEGKHYSYPLELENILKNKAGRKIEVNNCGQGGYTSADLLIRFLLQVVDTEPDLIIIYHAYADIRSYLSDDFQADYSHSRQNLAKNYSKLKLGSKVPKTPLNFINYLSSHWFPYNTRLSLNELVHKKSINEINLNLDYSRGLKTYERNLQFVLDVCKSKNIKVILSTFCNYLHKDAKEEPLHKAYNKIITEENNVMKKISKINNIKLVDNASLVPNEEKYFVDTVHFTHEGMKELAKNFSKEII
jgi:lysophospholipase L1-like esterase